MRLHAVLASLILAMPFGAQAVPITYDLFFSGNGGPSSGTFTYETEIPTFRDFTIRFDAFAGGPRDFGVRVFGFEQDVFEVLTGEPLREDGCASEGVSCLISVGLVGLFDLELSFARSARFAEYQLLDANGLVSIGGFIARERVAAVAEPAGMALLGLGLLMLATLGRRQRGTGSVPQSCQNWTIRCLKRMRAVGPQQLVDRSAP